jgi:hypothetical protein
MAILILQYINLVSQRPGGEDGSYWTKGKSEQVNLKEYDGQTVNLILWDGIKSNDIILLESYRVSDSKYIATVNVPINIKTHMYYKLKIVENVSQELLYLSPSFFPIYEDEKDVIEDSTSTNSIDIEYLITVIQESDIDRCMSYDILGKVHNDTRNKYAFIESLSGLNRGVYFVRTESYDGEVSKYRIRVF